MKNKKIVELMLILGVTAGLAGRTGKGSEKCLSELGCCDCSRTDL